MSIYFSPSLGGFVHEGVREVPDDAVALTEGRYKALLAECSAGKQVAVVDGEAVAVDPVVPAPVWDDIRRTRNSRLRKTDWTQMPDAPLDEEEKAAWRDYRQALRNLTESFANPNDVVWPTAPGAE